MSSLFSPSPSPSHSPSQLLLDEIQKLIDFLNIKLKKNSGKHETWYTTSDKSLLYYYALEEAYNEYLRLCQYKCSSQVLQNAIADLIMLAHGCHKHIPCLQTNVDTL